MFDNVLAEEVSFVMQSKSKSFVMHIALKFFTHEYQKLSRISIKYWEVSFLRYNTTIGICNHRFNGNRNFILLDFGKWTINSSQRPQLCIHYFQYKKMSSHMEQLKRFRFRSIQSIRLMQLVSKLSWQNAILRMQRWSGMLVKTKLDLSETSIRIQDYVRHSGPWLRMVRRNFE